MWIFKILVLSLISLALIVSFAVAGDIVKGKALFNDPALGAGTAGKSCNSCHPEGKGLEKTSTKNEFNLGGKKQKSLEDALNVCIVNANKGTALDPKSQEMQDLIAYIKSLAK